MADRANIRTRARARADQSTGAFPSNTVYNLFIDEAAKEVWLDLYMAGYPLDEASFDIDVGVLGAQDTYAVSSGGADVVLAVNGVYKVDGTRVRELPRLNRGIQEVMYRSDTGGEARAYLVVHRATAGVVQPRIQLFPKPSSGLYRVVTIFDFPGFTNDASVWPGPHRSDELVVLRSAEKGLKMEGEREDARELREEYKELLLKIQRSAPAVDARNPPTIRDVVSVERDPFDYDIHRGYY